MIANIFPFRGKQKIDAVFIKLSNFSPHNLQRAIRKIVLFCGNYSARCQTSCLLKEFLLKNLTTVYLHNACLPAGRSDIFLERRWAVIIF